MGGCVCVKERETESPFRTGCPQGQLTLLESIPVGLSIKLQALSRHEFR